MLGFFKRNIESVNKCTERSMKAFDRKAGKKAGDMVRGSISSFKLSYDINIMP